MKRLVLALILSVCSFGTQAAGISGQGTWETTLLVRDVDNNGTADAFYDTVLDITWLADANYAVTSGYLPAGDGSMTLADGESWIGTLNSANFLGANTWRLPKMLDTGLAGCDLGYTGTDCGSNVDTSTGELASLFYDTLGNIPFYDIAGNASQPGWGLSNTGPFENIQNWYMYGTVYLPGQINGVWDFHFDYGLQDWAFSGASAWAVADGDIAIVPIPAAAWMFGSALGLLGWMRRKSA